MKLTILQENLKRGLGIVSKSISNRPQLPVLANVLLDCRKDGLYLTGTDLELGIRTKVGAKVEEEGKVTVPAKMFADFVASLPAGKLEIAIDGESLKVDGGVYKASFQTISADEYPDFPKIDGDGGVKVVFGGDEFFEGLRRVIYAAAKDSMRPILTGVLFEMGKKKTRLVATDGFRLSLFELGVGNGVEGEVKVVVPARAVMELLRVGEGDVEVVFLQESNQVVFKVGEVVLITQVLEGSFPAYRKIIPDDFGVKIEVDRKELLEGVGVAQVFAKDDSNILRWEVGSEGIVIKSKSPEQGENEVRVQATVEGGGVEMAFSGRFLLDFLQNVKGEKIWIGLGDRLAPGAFRELGEEKGLYIVMPINL